MDEKNNTPEQAEQLPEITDEPTTPIPPAEEPSPKPPLSTEDRTATFETASEKEAEIAPEEPERPSEPQSAKPLPGKSAHPAKKRAAPKSAAPKTAGPKKKAPAKKKKRKKVELPTEEDPWEEERNYRPIRTRRDGRIGCLGGLMYAVFIISASILLAVFGWIRASDLLALNKESNTVEITLPETVFTEKEVEVKNDDGLVTGIRTVRTADINAVAGVLKDYGLINYKWLFKLYSRFSHAENQLDPGTYVLTTNLDYRALVKKMQSGAGSQLQTLVMLPEGYNMDQIFEKLEKEGVCSREDLYEAAAQTEFSYAFLEDMETGDAYRLEGYLFPDTYYFYQGMQAASAINKFLSNFHYRITDEMWQRTKALNLSFREMLTVASLIEKEAADDDERALIASVIYNRLASGMPLQIDATVIYALRDEGYTRLTTELIQSTDSPYNTYLYTGLTPGPICSPGMASIQAALDPASTGYYYYALDVESGTHRFFTNLDDHEAFVATQDYG